MAPYVLGTYYNHEDGQHYAFFESESTEDVYTSIGHISEALARAEMEHMILRLSTLWERRGYEIVRVGYDDYLAA